VWRGVFHKRKTLVAKLAGLEPKATNQKSTDLIHQDTADGRKRLSRSEKMLVKDL
jgi:hypothetical protein